MSVQDKPRKLKVYYTYHRNSKTRQPMIRLGGRYLSRLNFLVGDMIVISVEGRRLVIEKVSG